MNERGRKQKVYNKKLNLPKKRKGKESNQGGKHHTNQLRGNDQRVSQPRMERERKATKGGRQQPIGGVDFEVG